MCVYAAGLLQQVSLGVSACGRCSSPRLFVKSLFSSDLWEARRVLVRGAVRQRLRDGSIGQAALQQQEELGTLIANKTKQFNSFAHSLLGDAVYG